MQHNDNKKPANYLHFYRSLSLLFCLILTACSADKTSEEAALKKPENCQVIPNQQSASQYTISWDYSSDSALKGYRIYYGTSAPLTKSRAQGFYYQDGDASEVTFIPAALNLTTCTTVFVAISAIGDRPESALSDVLEIVIE